MTEESKAGPKALVTVFDNLESATRVIEKLVESGVDKRKIELVSHHIAEEAPEVETPRVHETTTSSLIDNAAKWGGAAAGTGLAIGMLTAFPGLALGMVIMGGVTGAIVGGMAGLEHAVEDDSVDMPTLEEYEQLVQGGDHLVVVLGDHDEVMNAEQVVQGMTDVRSHIHPVHGKRYHEHPAHGSDES